MLKNNSAASLLNPLIDRLSLHCLMTTPGEGMVLLTDENDSKSYNYKYMDKLNFHNIIYDNIRRLKSFPKYNILNELTPSVDLSKSHNKRLTSRKRQIDSSFTSIYASPDNDKGSP